MSEPSFENSKKRCEDTCRILINGSLINFQEIYERKIESVTIELEEIKPEIVKVKSIKIHLKP
jgi:hypothetical protein